MSKFYLEKDCAEKFRKLKAVKYLMFLNVKMIA